MRETAKEQRSPHWAHARDSFLKDNSTCAACGSANHVQVHHVEPFHLHPELELDPNNFIALCMDVNECHLRIGHGGSFKAYNPGVRASAAAFKYAGDEGRRVIVESAKANRLV